MRALRIHGYGGPEVMRLDEVDDPSPSADQLLLKVSAASVNPIDWKMRRGLLAKVFPLQFPRILGRDCAGESDGRLYAGVADMRMDGTHAEYVLLPEGQAAPVPAGLDAASAASLCIAGLSAYIPLVEIAQVKRGMRVLVHAGAGGVGSLAVQIARQLGAEVVATASAENRDYCKSLGAAQVLDYRKEPLGGGYDVVLDTIGGETHLRSIQALRPGGIVVALAAAPIPPGGKRADVRVAMAQIQPTRERLQRVFELGVRPQVKNKYVFAEAAAAYARSESGHARGKIVLLPG